jgi:hypothetical protein
MRLDRVGLLGDDSVWDRTNRVTIGDNSPEYRYLPYLPLWWPKMDGATGKELIEENEEDAGDDDEGETKDQ